MSHTNTTTNYGLPQFLSSDKPAWMSDINVAFADIDAQMKTNADAASAAQTTADDAVLNGAPGYSNLSTYAVGDVVNYLGRVYKCDIAVVTPEAFDSAKWSLYRLSDVSAQIDVIDSEIGTTDISSLGDGTITGAISALNGNVNGNAVSVSSQSAHVTMTMNNSTVQGSRVSLIASAVSDESGGRVSTAQFLQIVAPYRPTSNRVIGCIITKADGTVVFGSGYVDSDGYLYQNISSTAQSVIFIGTFTYGV